MRREWLIISSVLVPFVVLVAFSMWWPEPKPPALAPLTPLPAEAGVSGLAMAKASSTVISALRDAGARPEEPLSAPVAAVAPLIRDCLADAEGRLGPHPAVEVRFEPTRDGGYVGVEVDSTLQDPYARACIEDAFLDVHFDPGLGGTWGPTRHTFNFDSPRR